MALRWSFLMYICYGFGGLAYFAIDVWKHGLAHPLRLAVSIAMFSLAVRWLIAAVKTRRPLTKRVFSDRNAIFALLLLAYSILGILTGL